MAEAVISRKVTGFLLGGQPGTGKSYVACKELAEVILPNLQGDLYTNLPLRVDAMVDYVASKEPAADREAFAESLRRRIHLIPADEAERWEKGESGPAPFFDNLYKSRRAEWEAHCREDELDPVDVEACTEAGYPPPPRPLAKGVLVVDEAGRCWPAMASGRYKDAVTETAKFLRTIRHEGAQFWLISQHEKDVDVKMRRLCGVRYFLVNWRNHRDPVFNIEVDDWLQLWAKCFGKYHTGCTLQEFVTIGHDEEECQRTDSFWLEAKYFALYDSHNIQGQQSGSEMLSEWQVLSWPKFAVWWLRRNWFPLGWRAAAAVVLLLSWVYLWEIKEFATVTVPNVAWPYVARYLPGGEKSQIGGTPGSRPGVVPPGQKRPIFEGSGSELLDGEISQVNKDQVRQLISDLQASREKLAAFETRYEGGRGISAVIGDVALTDDGEVLHVGERVALGGFEGRVPRLIGRDGVVFDDGTKYRVQRRKALPAAKGKDADPAASLARVPAAAPGALPAVASPSPGTTAGEGNDSVSGGSLSPPWQRGPGVGRPAFNPGNSW